MAGQMCHISRRNPSALRNSPMKQSLGKRTSQQCIDAGPASRFSKDGDIAWVPAEATNVLLHPLKRRQVVQNSIVTGHPSLRLLR